MPHKRNPVLTENLTGLARMVRSAVTPALENVALWHERDISHSSVERFIGPDATITLDFALARLTSVVDKLVVYPERMQKNLDRMGGLVHSQRVLLALTQAGVTRDEAYRLVQRNAMKVWESDGQLSLLELLKADPDYVPALTACALAQMTLKQEKARNLLKQVAKMSYQPEFADELELGWLLLAHGLFRPRQLALQAGHHEQCV
jgi:adenylosuccinate lyase